jgi:hypothetical protein
MAVIQMLIVGKSAILMNNPSSMRGGEEELQRGGKKIPSPLDEARAKLYAQPSGQLYIKSDSFREACLEASKQIRDPSRKGRASMLNRFASSVFLCTELCLLYRADDNHAPIMSEPEPSDVGDLSGEWEIDRRRAVVVKQGIIRARPLIRKWCCPLEFEIDEDTINENLVLVVAQQSGKFPGILDYRVGRKGPFGRYTAELLNGTKFGTVDAVKKGKRK